MLGLSLNAVAAVDTTGVPVIRTFLEQQAEAHPTFKEEKLNVTGMMTTYQELKKKIDKDPDNKDKKYITGEDKVRPIVLASVFGALNMDERFAAANSVPYIEGSRLVGIYSHRGWGMFLVRKELPFIQLLGPKMVVEVTLPALSDFTDINDAAGVNATIASMKAAGTYGITRIRTDCTTLMEDLEHFAILCGPYSPAKPVINANKFTPETINWIPAAK